MGVEWGGWLSLRCAGRGRGGGKDSGSRGTGSPREVRSFPRNDPLAVLPPPPVKASHRPLPKGAAQAPRPAPALTAASLHIVLSSGRPWSSPGLMAAAATLSAHPTPCSG